MCEQLQQHLLSLRSQLPARLGKGRVPDRRMRSRGLRAEVVQPAKIPLHSAASRIPSVPIIGSRSLLASLRAALSSIKRRVARTSRLRPMASRSPRRQCRGLWWEFVYRGIMECGSASYRRSFGFHGGSFTAALQGASRRDARKAFVTRDMIRPRTLGNGSGPPDAARVL